ncbi:hypothetical protein TSUD_229550 [Trifolium subterraneum]|uniref:Uncharacterized protein n=1 Tax=Trifolium subterraneum TaxID=3900 RepID=A0A2Z6LMN0_TRISU|nr:hypothetical protein TSUD_229550 [Trifolium subterraneum]
MGGSIAVHVAARRSLSNLAGLIVVDVVEIEWSVRAGTLRNVDSARVSVPATIKYDDSRKCYVYRTELEKTEQYWKGWSLTIGQMQGKFQMIVVRHTGHAIQEDVPDEFATLVINFISRNQIGPNGVVIPGLRKPAFSKP